MGVGEDQSVGLVGVAGDPQLALVVEAVMSRAQVGLLEPVDIDSGSGYRRYSTAQVSTAQAIRRFRELDMLLEQVRAVLDAPDVTSRNEAILTHLRHMQQQLERTRRRSLRCRR